MAEAAEKDSGKEKKKGSKLPMIVGMVVMLAAGGFFGMKMKGGGKHVKPEVKLSKEKPVDLKEFLVNLKDRNVLCRAEISLGLAEGVDAKGMEDQTPVIRDAVNMVLQSESIADVSTPQGMKLLKIKLAAAINEAYDQVEGKKDPAASDDATDDSSKDGSKDGSKDAKSDAKGDAKAGGAGGNSAAKADASTAKGGIVMPKHADWDSDTGPVLKIYFDSFATE